MELFKDRRAVALAGMGLALLAGLAIAAFLMLRDRGASEPPPASQGGLIVQTGRDDDVKLDEGRPLRCFVNGQLVGDLKLSDCAKRNGVASGALDVGLDPTGALAAAHGDSSQITPLPPAEASSDVEPQSPGGAVSRGSWISRRAGQRPVGGPRGGLLALRRRQLEPRAARPDPERVSSHPIPRPLRAGWAARLRALGRPHPTAGGRPNRDLARQSQLPRPGRARSGLCDGGGPSG